MRSRSASASSSALACATIRFEDRAYTPRSTSQRKAAASAMIPEIVSWIRMSAASSGAMSRQTTTAPTTWPFCFTGIQASSARISRVPGPGVAAEPVGFATMWGVLKLP
ncbi:MAG: hypothetical protein DME05_25905 [Candidatus Rokuibacteriota bacterium]|nr:MAG: hypothetical protein DME05_25905 [Candidatus Rokubacteria bacterium]